jgi:hypothetical protein
MSVQPNKARLLKLLAGLRSYVTFSTAARVKLGGGHLNTVVLSGGGTTTLTAADSGATCVFDTAAASTFVLPDPELGMRFTFIQTIINTADHVIQTSTNDHGFLGGVTLTNTTDDQTDTFSTATDGNNDFITLNATTTGGAAAGSIIHVYAILNSSAAKCWAVHGSLIVSGDGATPFGDAQL